MKSKSKIAAEFLNDLSADAKLSWSKITDTPMIYFTSGVGTVGIAASTDYALFPSGSDTISLSVGTYKIRIQALVNVATSTVSATLLLDPKGAGTAVGTVFGKSFGSITNGGNSILTNVGSTTLGTAFTVTAASAVAGRAYNAVFEGILNISTAGTLIPSYSFSAALTSGVTTLNAANNIIIEKISNTVSTINGGWY